MKQSVSRHKKNKKELNPLYSYIRQTEKKRRSDYDKFLEAASEHLSIPKDVIAGQPLISMTGNRCIRISNYQAIEEYSTEQIKIQLKKKSVCILGEQLMMEYFRKDEVKIVGNILNISFIH